ncbi:MAG: zinc-dependent metalloprotease [Bradymonadaceae bacterium]
MNGELSNQSIRYGTHIEEYLNSVQNRRQQGLKPGELSAEAERALERRANRNPREVSSTNFTEELPDPEDLPDRIKRLGVDGWNKKLDELSRNIETAKDSDTTLTQFYEQPKVKKQLMRDGQFQTMVRSIAQQRFGQNPSKQQMHQAYLDVANPRMLHRRQQQAQRWMSEHSIFAARNLRRAVEGLATYKGVAEAFKGMPRKKLVRYIRDNAFIGTQLHEVGHTLGLRHNFSASRDALNWHDEYWKIQKEVATNENVVKELPGSKAAEGKQSAYALQGDIIEKIAGNTNSNYLNEEEFQQASIMDYTADLTGRFAGLGKYDQAAINFAYAKHIEVWKGFDKPNRLSFDKWLADYSRLPKLYGKAKVGSDASEEKQIEKGVEIITDKRKWIPVEKAMKNRLQGIRDNTKLAKKWWGGKGAEPSDPAPYIPKTVPYNFCSDYKRDYARNCSAFDHGGNYSEVVNHQFNSWRFFQPFWRYKGQNIDYGFPFGYKLIANYALRMQRTLYAAERPFRFFSIYEWLGYDLGDYTEDLKAASIDALNFYAEVMAMPEPGRYCKYDAGNFRYDKNWYYELENTYVPADQHSQLGNCQNSIDIPRGVGQFYNYETTDEYNFRIRRVGTYVDKMLASQSFFSISGNWINSGFITDSRTTNITFYSLFKDEMLNWLGAMIMGNTTGFAGTLVEDPDTGKKRYEPPKVIDLDSSGNGSETQLGTNKKRVRSPFSFNQELTTLAGAMLVNSSWQDQSVDFRQYTKVIREENDKQTFGDKATIHEFTHPVTQVTYQALKTPDQQSISVKLVKWAKDMKAQWEYASCLKQNFDPNKSNPEEHLKNICGERQLPVSIRTFSSDAIQETRNQISDLEERRLRQLEEIVAKMTMMRDIHQLTDLE